MKLKEFKRVMIKKIFTTNDVRVVAFNNKGNLINLLLHNWRKSGDLIRLKRGLYTFRDTEVDLALIAKSLHSPCYFSLEYVLNLNGIIPEAVFAYTLVTPGITKKYDTQYGTYIYHKIKKEAFTGFDRRTLMAEKEKAIVDYLYLNKATFVPKKSFWKESRINTENLDLSKVKKYVRLYNSKKLNILIGSLLDYAKPHKNY